MGAREFYNTLYNLADDRADGILRKDIYFCKTSGVPDPEFQAIVYGFQKIIQESNRNVTPVIYGYYKRDDDAFGSPDWYQTEALTNIDRGFGPQVSAKVIDKLLRDEPFQKTTPHFDVMVIDMDLRTSQNDEQNNFIFGYGPYPNNIISVKRFMHWIPDDELRYKSLAVLGAHEFGHNIDLVHRTFNTGNEGYKYGHCNGESGPCLMEQVNVRDARSIDEQAALIYDRENWLCKDCLDEINYKIKEYKEMNLPW